MSCIRRCLNAVCALFLLIPSPGTAAPADMAKPDKKVSEGYLKVEAGMTMAEVTKLMGRGSEHSAKSNGNCERHVWTANGREHAVFFKDGIVTHRGTATPNVITAENLAKIMMAKSTDTARDLLGFPNKSKGDKKTNIFKQTWEDGEKYIILETKRGDVLAWESSEMEAATQIVKKMEEAAKKPEKLFAGVYSKDIFERRAAYAKIAETPFDEKIADEVSKIVVGGLKWDDSSIVESCLKAMPVWGGKAGVEALLKWAELPVKNITDPNRDKRRKAIETLTKMKAAASAAFLAQMLKEFHEQDWASKELIKLGAEKAEKEVLDVYNHKMAMGEARKILKEFKTSDEKILDQCLSDLKERRKVTETWLNAVGSLVNMQVIEKRRKDVLAAAEEIVNEQSDYSADAIFIYRTWGGKEHLPMLDKLAKTAKKPNLKKAAQMVGEEIAKKKG